MVDLATTAGGMLDGLLLSISWQIGSLRQRVNRR